MSELSQTPGNVLMVTGGTKRTVVSGGTITAGMPVYKDTADSDKYKASRANAAGTAVCDGIALTGSSSGQPLVVQEAGDLALGATLVAGETYVVSDATAGKIMPVGDLGSGDYPVILGVASSASNFKLGIKAAGVAKS